MIPQFPNFKKLEFSDREEFETFTHHHKPYSDFNFVSLWSYNVQDDIVVSQLNGNLVMRFRDYITGDPFFTFIGSNLPIETITTLLDHAHKEKVLPELKLIPEDNISNVNNIHEYFDVKEDKDNFDYIHIIEELAQLNKVEYYSKRKHVNNFYINHNDHIIKVIDLTSSEVQKDVMATFHMWAEKKGKTDTDIDHERTAIKRLLQHGNNFRLTVLGVYQNNIMKGFAIAETVQDNHSVFHFIKADPDNKTMYSALYNAIAKELHQKGVQYLNNEQDLGIENLRKAKEFWNPSHFLKKYIISRKK